MKKIHLVIQEDTNRNSSGGVPIRAFEREDKAEKYARSLNRQYTQCFYCVHSVKLYETEDK
jgi:hypothetical protein